MTKEIKEKHYTNSWMTIFSILMFFVSFFAAYFVSGNELSNAFVRSCFVLIVANVLSRILVIVWNCSIPKDQWLLIVHGPPSIDSRSVKLRKEREKERESLNLEKEIDDDDFVLES